MNPWENLFPFSRIRDSQREAIDFALDAFASGKRFVIMELPTGSGKSAIGVTIARALETDAYLLTTQKVLQEQYVDDFGPTKLKLVQSIKSASNYDCHSVWGQSCAESRRIIAALKKRGYPPQYQGCRDACPYMEDKKAFIASPLGVTNFSYFLAETMYAKQLKPRGLLVCDEAHNIESQLSGFIEVSFSVKFAKQQLDCKAPRTRTAEGVLSWIRRSYRPALVKRLAELEETVDGGDDDESSTLAKRLEMLDKHLCKVNRFLATYKSDNWIMNAVEPGSKAITSRRNQASADWKFEFKPIDVSPYAEDALYHYGDKVLMMSATIIDPDVFCRVIGVNPTEVAFLRSPSAFPPENRPVHYMPAGSMSRKHIDETLPVLVEAVKMLLEQHSSEKGIIHCVEASTPVLTSQNTTIPISNIESGTQIVSWDETSQTFTNQVVVDVIDQGVRDCIQLSLENGQEIICTPDHRILTKNRGWIAAQDLTENDDIVSVHDTYLNASSRITYITENR